MATDKRGVEIEAGDLVAYPYRKGSWQETKLARVEGLETAGNGEYRVVATNVYTGSKRRLTRLSQVVVVEKAGAVDAGVALASAETELSVVKGRYQLAKDTLAAFKNLALQLSREKIRLERANQQLLDDLHGLARERVGLVVDVTPVRQQGFFASLRAAFGF